MSHSISLPWRRVVTLALAMVLTGCAGLRQSLANQACDLHQSEPYTIVEATPDRHEVRLYRLGSPTTLAEVQRHLEAAGDSVVALTNAGIFEPGYVPTGLYIEEGVERQALNLEDGWGNFFLQPNGVFYVDAGGQAHVVASTEWKLVADSVAYATQSGPLLLAGGRVHPRFREGSSSCRLRSGVGVRPGGTTVLAISNGAVNFYDVAVFFRDELGTADALYLDGSISRMVVPASGRHEDGFFAAVLAVVARR